MKPVTIGFFGCGFMGQLAHLQNYIWREDCKVVAVCDSKKQQAEKVAAHYGIEHVYTSLADLLAHPELDAVVAAQPFQNHVNVVPEILKAGKHVLTEKPLCVYPQHGETLARLAAEQGVVHMVAYHKRSDPAVEYAVATINQWKQSGLLGDMRYVRITMPPGDWVGGMHPPLMSNETPHSFVPEPRPEGISEEKETRLIEFVNYYIHQVNLLRYLLGENYTLTFADRAGVLLAVESSSGVTGTIEMAPYETTDDWQEKALVCFDKGFAEITLPAPLASQQAGTVTLFQDFETSGIHKGGSWTCPRLPNVSAMENQAANFIAAVQGVRPAPTTSAEAVMDLELALDYIDYMERYK